MPFRLLSHDRCCPGEFRYAQSFGGKARKFGPEPVIHDLAKKVADFRRGNGLPRADTGAALEDIDAFNCARLGNDPRWVHNTDIPFSQIAQLTPSADCATCGK